MRRRREAVNIKSTVRARISRSSLVAVHSSHRVERLIDARAVTFS